MKCNYLGVDGICTKSKGDEVTEYCVEGPCGSERLDKTSVELAIIVLAQLMGCTGITCEDCEIKFGHFCFVADREASLGLAIEALRSKSAAEEKLDKIKKECEMRIEFHHGMEGSMAKASDQAYYRILQILEGDS